MQNKKKLTPEEKRRKHADYKKLYRDRNREKINRQAKKYRDTNPDYKEKHRLYAAEWREKNREKFLELSRNNYKKNGAKYNETKKNSLKHKQKRIERETKQRDELDTIYVVRVLKQQTKRFLKQQTKNVVTAIDIPAELVELKKNTLKLKREIKNKQK